MSRFPPDWRAETDPVLFALSIVNEPGNRDRDTEWYRELQPWIDESLERIRHGKPPAEIEPGKGIQAWPLMWVMRNGEAVLIAIRDGKIETNRALVPNGIMMLWNDHERRAKLWRCGDGKKSDLGKIPGCRRWYFRERPRGAYCSAQCRRSVSNAKRKKTRKQKDRARYHDPELGFCTCHGDRIRKR
jgi:hypothetical protein